MDVDTKKKQFIYDSSCCTCHDNLQLSMRIQTPIGLYLRDGVYVCVCVCVRVCRWVCVACVCLCVFVYVYAWIRLTQTCIQDYYDTG